MLFRNYTPFPPLQFESRDENRRDFGVIVLRGTFRIIPGERLRLVQDQQPLVMADEYHGDPTKSSLKFESSIAPYKPKTDVLLTADAHAPRGRPADRWTCGVRFGEVEKSFDVTGPRAWRRRFGGRDLTPIEPAATVPVRYEYAYGGSFRAGATTRTHRANPVGRGFADPTTPDPIPAPQILPAGSGDPAFGRELPVEGLGPLAPAWSPRTERAGTFNAVWEKTRWPDLPEDFSFEFYNTASRGLTLDGFAKGTEWVRVTNLTPSGDCAFELPHFTLATLLRFEDGRLVPGPIVLDTVHLDLTEARAYLTWRGLLPVDIPLRVLEVRMDAPADVIARPDEDAAGADDADDSWREAD